MIFLIACLRYLELSEKAEKSIFLSCWGVALPEMSGSVESAAQADSERNSKNSVHSIVLLPSTSISQKRRVSSQCMSWSEVSASSAFLRSQMNFSRSMWLSLMTNYCLMESILWLLRDMITLRKSQRQQELTTSFYFQRRYCTRTGSYILFFTLLFIYLNIMQAYQPSNIIISSMLTPKAFLVSLTSLHRNLLSSILLNPSIQFSVSTQKSSYQADHLFKDYYSRRLSLSHSELLQFFTQISQHPFSQQDHRWISLTQNLQKNVDKFKAENQVFMCKTLVDLQSKTQLTETLREGLIKRTELLSFDQTAILLWCIAKHFKKEQLAQLSTVYKRLTDLLFPEKEDISQPEITIKKKQQESQQSIKKIKITASSLSMVLSSMASLGIADKKIMKRLIQDGIRANLPDFSCTSLCTFLIAFQKLGLRNKRDTFEVYKTLRTQHKQLQTASLETLLNLAISLANLSKRELSEQEKKRLQLHPDQSQKQQAQLQDMRIFFGWICQTILLREPSLLISKAALMLHYARKIQYFHKEVWQKACRIISGDVLEAKIVDLVMATKAIASLNKQNRQFLQQEEETILSRLWQLQSSISGKSLHALALLLKLKKIKPPPKIAKMLNQYLIQMQTSKNKPREMTQGQNLKSEAKSPMKALKD